MNEPSVSSVQSSALGLFVLHLARFRPVDFDRYIAAPCPAIDMRMYPTPRVSRSRCLFG